MFQIASGALNTLYLVHSDLLQRQAPLLPKNRVISAVLSIANRLFPKLRYSSLRPGTKISVPGGASLASVSRLTAVDTSFRLRCPKRRFAHAAGQWHQIMSR